MSGIRTEIEIGSPGDCLVAQASAEAGATIDHVSRSSTISPGGTVTEEFAIDANASLDRPDAEEVFGAGTHRIYRFDREHGAGCVCECIERYGCPVTGHHARDGHLYVSFYAPDVGTVRSVVDDLLERFDDVQVRQLIREDENSEQNFALVDRSRFTDRQREVLDTCYEMGYFDHPKRANAKEVAEELDIAPSTFSEHLGTAQRKLLEMVLDV